MPRIYKKKTTEEKLLSLIYKSLDYVIKTVSGKVGKPDVTRLNVCWKIIALQLDKDKREGKSSSSYESILMNKKKEKK